MTVPGGYEGTRGAPIRGGRGPSVISCWRQSCMCPGLDQVLSPGPDSLNGSTRAWVRGSSSSSHRPATAKPCCSPSGPGAEHALQVGVSVDAGDNDPRRFWRHALAALEPLSPAISERVGPLAGSPAPPTFEPLVTALINDLVGVRRGGRGAARPRRLPPDQIPTRCTHRSDFFWSTDHRSFAWCWPVVPTRRCRWLG